MDLIMCAVLTLQKTYLISAYCTDKKGELKEVHRTYKRTKASIKHSIKILKKYSVFKITLESTGTYHTLIVSELKSYGFFVMLINPLLIRNPTRTKRDKLDARRLAIYTLQGVIAPDGSVQPSYVSDDRIEVLLRQITRNEFHLKKESTKIKNRIHKIFNNMGLSIDQSPFSKFSMTALMIFEAIWEREMYENFIFRLENSSKTIIKENIPTVVLNNLEKHQRRIEVFLEESFFTMSDFDKIHLKFLVEKLIHTKKSLDDTERLIKSYLERASDQLKRRIEIANSIRGVGETLAVRIAVEFGDMKRFNNRRQVGSYTGLEPVVRSSGGSAHIGRVSKLGNKHLRRYLYQAASTAKRFNPKHRNLYSRLKHRGKKHTQATVAVARKLAEQYYSLVKNDELYDENKDSTKLKHKEDW